MKKINSLSKHLTQRLIVGTLLVWSAAIGLTYLSVGSALERYFDVSLEETAQRILPLALDDYYSRQITQGGISNNTSIKPQFSNRLFSGNATSPDHEEDIVYRLIDSRSGDTVINSHQQSDNLALANLEPGFFQSNELRAFNLHTQDGRFILQIHERRDLRFSAIQDVLFSFFVPISVALPLLILLVTVSIQRGLKPLHRLTALIQQQNPNSPKPLQELELPTELKPVHRRLNELLGRVDQLLERERQFASNTAHELRTPLALMKGEITQLMDASHNRQIQNDLSHLMREVDRLVTVTEKLLQLARADASESEANEEVSLVQVIQLILMDLREQPSDHQIAIDSSTKIRTDIDAFGILMKNLIENALKYRTEGSILEIYLREGELQIMNQTDLELDTDTQQLFLRGSRQQLDRAKGSGLGLSITKTIAQRLGLELNLMVTESNEKRIFCARLAVGNYLVN